MTPPNVSVQSGTPAGAATPAAPAAVQPAPTDFLLMLSQMAGAPAVVAQVATALESPVEKTTPELPDAEELVGMFSLSLPVAASDLRDIAAAAQSFGVSGLQGAEGKVASALAAELQPLMELTTTAEPVEDLSGGAFESLHVQAGSSEKSHTLQSLTAAAAVSRTVQQPVGSAAWADEIGSRVMMMAEQGRQTASLRLSPEHLGPLEINITIQDDRASVWFGAAHADTRSAIEHALPRLRELFESQGMSLTDAGVYRESPREQAAVRASEGGSDGDVATDDEDTVATSVRRGLVDAYA